MQYIPAYACKQELCHVVGGNVWCAHQESLAQQTSYGRVFQDYKSRLTTNRRYDDISGKFFTPEDHTIGKVCTVFPRIDSAELIFFRS